VESGNDASPMYREIEESRIIGNNRHEYRRQLVSAGLMFAPLSRKRREARDKEGGRAGCRETKLSLSSLIPRADHGKSNYFRNDRHGIGQSELAQGKRAQEMARDARSGLCSDNVNKSPVIRKNVRGRRDCQWARRLARPVHFLRYTSALRSFNAR